MIGGCIDNGNSNDDGNGDQQPTWQTLIDNSRRIKEDEYRYHKISLDQSRSFRTDVTVREGPAIDVVFTTQSEFQEFKQGNRFKYNSGLSMLDTTGGRRSSSLPSGNYVFLLDNTNAIEAKPPTNFDDDLASVDYKLEYK